MDAEPRMRRQRMLSPHSRRLVLIRTNNHRLTPVATCSRGIRREYDPIQVALQIPALFGHWRMGLSRRPRNYCIAGSWPVVPSTGACPGGGRCGISVDSCFVIRHCLERLDTKLGCVLISMWTWQYYILNCPG